MISVSVKFGLAFAGSVFFVGALVSSVIKANNSTGTGDRIGSTPSMSPTPSPSHSNMRWHATPTPSGAPTVGPTPQPSSVPSPGPSPIPSTSPSSAPTLMPSSSPTSVADSFCGYTGPPFDLSTLTLETLDELASETANNNTLDLFGEYFDADHVTPAYDYTNSNGQVFEIKPIIYRGLPHENQECTQVFAWLSTPVNVVNGDRIPVTSGDFPAMVLLHGGGGTAFKYWCEKWADFGYASIAMGLEGQTDEEISTNVFKKVALPGPKRTPVSYSDWDLPLGNQWMYHCVANGILANTLLRNHPSVDASLIGATGVSWGGVITSTLIGFDKRFIFAVPAYGCGSLSQSLSHLGRFIRLGNATYYDEIWDPASRMSEVQIPTYWMSWPDELHFPMPNLAETYNNLTAPFAVSVIPDLGHGHYPIFHRQEPQLFANQVINPTNVSNMFMKQVYYDLKSHPSDPDAMLLEVHLQSSQPLSYATLITSTNGTDVLSSQRDWSYSPVDTFVPLSCGGNPDCTFAATVAFDINVTSWYITFCTAQQGACGSSVYKEE